MTIREALQSQRRVLLDLTYRNRLLSLPKRVSARSIVIHDELSAQVAAILLQKKGMTFAPVPGGRDEEALSKDEQVRDAEEVVLPQPAEDELDENGVAARHALDVHGLERVTATLLGAVCDKAKAGGYTSIAACGDDPTNRPCMTINAASGFVAASLASGLNGCGGSEGHVVVGAEQGFHVWIRGEDACGDGVGLWTFAALVG